MLRTNLALAVVLMLWTPFDAHATCKQVKAESDILGIRIANEASSARILDHRGSCHRNRTRRQTAPMRSFRSVRNRSANGEQDARLFEHYGAVVGAYAEIEVGPADPTKVAARQLPANELSTKRGVRRNAAGELVRLLGTCFRSERGKGDEAIVVYTITDPKHALLTRAGMPSIARYAFKNDRLAWFRFGFEYP